MKLCITMALAAALAPGAFVSAQAQVQLSPKEAIAARASGYRETGAAFKTINDQLRTGAPVKILMRTAAHQIVATGRDQYLWFPPGSGPEAGVKTRAKPIIWTDQAGFHAAQDRLQQQAALMAQVVETGDVAAMQTQARALGEACAGCHSKYRAPD